MSFTRRFFVKGAISLAAFPIVQAHADDAMEAFFANVGQDLNLNKFLKSSNPNKIDSKFQRREVHYPGNDAPGSIIIDTSQRFLYFVQENNTAVRYGVGVGRAGFEWKGTAKIRRKTEWPSWHPPAAMRRRQPELPVMMPGGVKNPLGARALYLYQGGVDTLYRIHGTNQPWSIGKALSSGCVRMLNKDVEDLYARVRMGAVVKVI